jgi:hypothetical protein
VKKSLLFIMFLSWLFGPPSNVQRGFELFESGKFQEAAQLWEAELENYPGQSMAFHHNLGLAYFNGDSVARSMEQFAKVANMAKQDPILASWSFNNSGVGILKKTGDEQQAQQQQAQQGMGMGMGMGMQGQAQQQGQQDAMASMEQALKSFQEALRLDHNNSIARYNYELLKHKMQQQQQQQEQQNEDQQQQNKDQQQEQNQNQQGQDQQEDSPPKQENSGQNQGNGQGQNEGAAGEMTEQEAQRLLDALNANEKKFLQQLEKGKKRKVYSEKDAHDW